MEKEKIILTKYEIIRAYYCLPDEDKLNLNGSIQNIIAKTGLTPEDAVEIIGKVALWLAKNQLLSSTKSGDI